MKVVFIMVGKTTNKHIAQLMLEYEERIKHYLPFEIKVVDDLRIAKHFRRKSRSNERESAFSDSYKRAIKLFRSTSVDGNFDL